jgi:hypothetical protein
MEIKVAGDKVPVYDLNLEDLGRFNEQPVLPFNAYGTLAWARGEFDNNSASSQVRVGCFLFFGCVFCVLCLLGGRARRRRRRRRRQGVYFLTRQRSALF